MGALLLQSWPYLVAGGAAAFALIKAYTMGKSTQKAKQAAADAASASEAQKIDDAVAGRAPDTNRERLGKWSPKQ